MLLHGRRTAHRCIARRFAHANVAVLACVCREFLPYMQSEIAALGDASLDQEVQILQKIIAS